MEGKGNQYSVATWLVSKQQFHSLLCGNKVFFCFCKCCLYWVNPSMFNSDNILWTSNEKNAFAKNRIYHIERPLSTRDASYPWDCWHDIFWLLTQENAKLYELYLIYPICFVNKCVWLPLFLSRFEGLRYVKSNSSVSGNTIKECSFQRILINIPQQPTKDASIEYSFLFAFLHYYYLVFIKSVSYSINLESDMTQLWKFRKNE